MDVQEFRQRGKELIDYIADYHENVKQRRVKPDVKPGFLTRQIPARAPQKGESWDAIMKDVEDIIQPGITHWVHPDFHAFFPANSSYPSILGEMLIAAFNCNVFTWESSPSCTELETVMMDWLARMMGLPEEFLFSKENSHGGGVLQTTASECIFLVLLAARNSALKNLSKMTPTIHESKHLASLTAYCSKEAHSCVEKACMVAPVKLRILDTDSKFRLRGSTLEEAIEEDRRNGFTPFLVFVTCGTTSSASCDKLDEIGPVCEKHSLWLHVDAAYAGAALVCPEFRYLLNGVSYAASFSMNPHKWLLVNLDCAALWVRDRFTFMECFYVDAAYLRHSDRTQHHVINYRHWGIALTRRFRALKLWFTLRNYGVDRLQSHIRNHIRLAKVFESLVLNDSRFEVKNEVRFGLVCFRLKGTNSLNDRLLKTVNETGQIFIVATSLNREYVLRFCVHHQNATEEDMVFAWEVVKRCANEVLLSSAQEST